MTSDEDIQTLNRIVHGFTKHEDRQFSAGVLLGIAVDLLLASGEGPRAISDIVQAGVDARLKASVPQVARQS